MSFLVWFKAFKRGEKGEEKEWFEREKLKVKAMRLRKLNL